MNILNNIEEVKYNLQQGKVIACNTDTICGLLVNGSNINYINKIYYLKKRPKNKKIVLFLTKEKNLLDYIEFIPEYFFVLYKEFVPGYLTFTFKSNKKTKEIFGDTIAIRFPSSESLIKLINSCSFNLLCTSANLSNQRDLYNLSEVGNIFKNKVLYWENNTHSVNVRSTIIDCTKEKPTLIREGYVEFEKILNSIICSKIK